MKKFAERLFNILNCNNPKEKRDIIMAFGYTPEAQLLFILTDRTMPAHIIEDLTEWAKKTKKKKNKKRDNIETKDSEHNRCKDINCLCQELL